MITTHGLKVYEKALNFGAGAEAFSASWGRRHAIVDHFRRASESIVVNIAEGTRLRSGPDKAKAIDYALGSTLECAASLDLAGLKGRLSMESSMAEKRQLLEVARMLIGLRRSWLLSVVNEEASPYGNAPSTGGKEVLFHHESLDVYRVGLDFMRWFVKLPGGSQLSDRLCREIDRAATSVVLNVAEGNGRYSELDHRRFLDIAAASAVKAAAYLDLYARKALPSRAETAEGLEYLSRVVAMLSQF